MPVQQKYILDPSITVNILYKDWPTVQSYFIQNYFEQNQDYSVVRYHDKVMTIRFFNRILYQDFSDRWEKVIVHMQPGDVPPETGNNS